MPTYEGVGDTLEAAFADAAKKAIEDDENNHKKRFSAKIVDVQVENPKITEYKVEIRR